MNTTSAVPADRGVAAPGAAAGERPILVWDLPTRVFHWLFAACFAGAWWTAEGERLRLVHLSLGYTLGGLLAFRLVWGLVGTRYARFADFVRGPQAAWRYLRALAAGRRPHHVGHNPAGAWAIVGLLALGGAIVASGVAMERGGLDLEDLHEGLASTMLALVGLHLAGVVVGSLAHRENLARAMLTGRKRGVPAEAIRRAWAPLGALLVAAVLGFWVLQWVSSPVGVDPAGAGATAATGPHGRDDDDD